MWLIKTHICSLKVTGQNDDEKYIKKASPHKSIITLYRNWEHSQFTPHIWFGISDMRYVGHLNPTCNNFVFSKCKYRGSLLLLQVTLMDFCQKIKISHVIIKDTCNTDLGATLGNPLRLEAHFGLNKHALPTPFNTLWSTAVTFKYTL